MDHSDRFAVLLRSLAQQADSHLVIDEIEPESDGMTLSGRAIRSDAITRMIQQLESTVVPVGWSVRPPSITGANRTIAGGPWTFSIELIDQQPKEVPQPTGIVRSSTSRSSVASLLKPSDAGANQQGSE